MSSRFNTSNNNNNNNKKFKQYCYFLLVDSNFGSRLSQFSLKLDSRLLSQDQQYVQLSTSDLDTFGSKLLFQTKFEFSLHCSNLNFGSLNMMLSQLRSLLNITYHFQSK